LAARFRSGRGSAASWSRSERELRLESEPLTARRVVAQSRRPRIAPSGNGQARPARGGAVPHAVFPPLGRPYSTP
jgi:hypothetical protein